jgi:hypothetical protein
LIDQGGFAEVMYQELYEKLGLGESDITNFTSPVFGFSGESTTPLGKTMLAVLARPDNLQTEFIVIQAPSPYNAIMGRDWLHRMKAVPSTLHQKLRFPTKDGVQEVDRLFNTVVVRKKNGKWRVCVDFSDLNKACPKDSFPFPRIDQLVDSASGLERLSFLDAFQGYHQIPMVVSDKEKTAFITPQGAYCYKVMPFGLKNARATYERMVTTMFEHLIGKTVEAYIDDMLIKSVRRENHLTNLREVFRILQRDRLCLNASKYVFRVGSDKFLGHIISSKGIEANSNQVSTLLNLEKPKDTKQVQRLTGMIAALGRFISRSVDKCRPFFQLLGKKRNFL